MLEATRGGTRRHLLDLLPGLTARGIECDLVYSPLLNPRFGDEIAQASGGRVGAYAVPMERGGAKSFNWGTRRWLRAHLKRNRYDIVHCHSSIAGLAGRMLPITVSAQVKVVYTPHCIAFDTGLPLSQRIFARLVERTLAPRTDCFIAVSQHEAEVIEQAKLAPPDRIATIYNGIDLAAFDAKPQLARNELGIDKNDYLIGCIDRLTRQKHQSALLHAVAQIRREVPHVSLLLVGSGEDEPALRQLASKLDIVERIVWHEPIPDPRSYYAMCDAIAHPSLWDSCPYTVIEAMATARPVIASAVGGVGELLGGEIGNAEAGMLYRLDSEAALAAHLATLANSAPQRRALGQAGRERAERHFTLGQMVEKTIAVYERTL